MKKTYRASAQMIRDMARIRLLLGEQSYLLFPPIARLRRGPHDFVAFDKVTVNFFMVRVGHNKIEVRRGYFVSATNRIIKKLRQDTSIVTPLRQRHLLLIGGKRAASFEERANWVSLKYREDLLRMTAR